MALDAGESQTLIGWEQRLQIALDSAVGEDYGRLQNKITYLNYVMQQSWTLELKVTSTLIIYLQA